MVAEARVACAEAALQLIQTIPLPGVEGRIDHLAIDAEGQRLFIAALGHGTVEIADLKAGKITGRIDNLREPQGVAYLPDQDEIAVACGGDGAVRFFAGKSLEPLG